MPAEKSIFDVCDMGCLISSNPIAFDMGSGYTRGPTAIVLRVVYRWCEQLGSVRHAPDLGVPVPLLNAEGTTWTPQGLRGLSATLRKQAILEDFVTNAACPATLSDTGNLHVAGELTLEGAGKYAFAIDAVGAYFALSGLNFTDAQIAQITSGFATLAAGGQFFGGTP